MTFEEGCVEETGRDVVAFASEGTGIAICETTGFVAGGKLALLVEDLVYSKDFYVGAGRTAKDLREVLVVI